MMLIALTGRCCRSFRSVLTFRSVLSVVQVGANIQVGANVQVGADVQVGAVGRSGGSSWVTNSPVGSSRVTKSSGGSSREIIRWLFSGHHLIRWLISGNHQVAHLRYYCIMGLIKGFQNTDIIGRVVIILLLVAQLFNWLSMCMNDWGLYDLYITNDNNRRGFGVWKVCGNQEPNANCVDIDGWRLEWYGVFQAFAIIAFLSTNLSFCFIILLIYVPRCLGKKDVAICCAVACFVTVVFYIIAVIIFGVKFDRTYDAGFDREILMTGFYFAIIVSVLSLVAGICIWG
ncbi:hypothetical protein Btru_064020 [Bulinus truncatus]|nr:hypothetical protein Btru_064020 [Bulinus truncatus]